MRTLLLAFLLIAAESVAPAEYLLGGSATVAAPDKDFLDRHAKVLTLGLNTDWMAASQIDPAASIGALRLTSEAISRGEIPGAVLHADRILGEVMPVGIGHLMTDPQKRPLAYDTMYHVGELTGPLLTAPVILNLTVEGKASLDDPIGRWVPELSNPALRGLTLRDLLQHRGGLPQEFPCTPAGFADRAGFFAAINAWKVDPSAAPNPGPAPYLLLTLAAEKITGEPFAEVARRDVVDYFQLPLATLQPTVDRRQHIAPEEYSACLGRLAWADPTDDLSRFLHPNCGHTGLILPADDLSIIARVWLSLALTQGSLPPEGRSPMTQLFLAADGTPALGFQSATYGGGAFGYDAPQGASLWMMPGQSAFMIFLSNRAHPDGYASKADPRPAILAKLAASLRPLQTTSPVDPAPQSASPSPP
jgi:CubicO group peptidase (beta-lactamase class C family)